MISPSCIENVARGGILTDEFFVLVRAKFSRILQSQTITNKLRFARGHKIIFAGKSKVLATFIGRISFPAYFITL